MKIPVAKFNASKFHKAKFSAVKFLAAKNPYFLLKYFIPSPHFFIIKVIYMMFSDGSRKIRRGKIHRQENSPPGKFAAGNFAAGKIFWT